MSPVSPLFHTVVTVNIGPLIWRFPDRGLYLIQKLTANGSSHASGPVHTSHPLHVLLTHIIFFLQNIIETQLLYKFSSIGKNI